jgi:uncharacterized protein involved in exopolysaccharide biosynthesis
VITISHTTHDREIAKRVVDALIEEFDLRHQQIYTARGAVQLLKRRQEEVLREAADADQALIRTHEVLGVADLPIERQKLLDSQYELDREIATILLDIKLEDRELERLQALLAAVVPATDPVSEIRWEPNPEHTRQQQLLDGLERRLAELRSTFSEDTRPVKNLEAEIRREQGKFADIQPHVRVEYLREPANEEYIRLAQLVADSTARLAALRTRQADREAHREAVAGRLRYLRDCEPQLTELQMHSQILRKSAEEAAAALENKRVLESLDEAQISNLVVLDWGTSPSDKSGPNRKQILLTGAFAGIAAGIGLALLRGFLDRRVHIPAELERAAGVPVIATIRRCRAPSGRPR